MLGGGHTGVFANLSARPELPRAEGGTEGPEWVPEVEGKDVPPTYEAALRDAVPPYWETTVVLPNSSGPFGKHEFRNERGAFCLCSYIQVQ
jgi:hypothetical protein